MSAIVQERKTPVDAKKVGGKSGEAAREFPRRSLLASRGGLC